TGSLVGRHPAVERPRADLARAAIEFGVRSRGDELHRPAKTALVSPHHLGQHLADDAESKQRLGRDVARGSSLFHLASGATVSQPAPTVSARSRGSNPSAPGACARRAFRRLRPGLVGARLPDPTGWADPTARSGALLRARLATVLRPDIA